MSVREYLNYGIIERIIAGTERFPQRALGPHEVEGGYIITAYHPSATGMQLKRNGEDKIYDMERVHEAGVYSVFVAVAEYKQYKLYMYFDTPEPYITEDPYAFSSVITESDCYIYGKGTHYEIYEKLGAHPMMVDGVYGVYFAVWAPHAKRVSIVGNFNMWDGRLHSMRGRDDCGIFELFVPHMNIGEIYKYEIMTAKGDVILKTDPYGNQFEVRPNNASVVADLRGFKWDDDNWIKERNKSSYDEKPVSIYEVHIGSWKKPEDLSEEHPFKNYREIAKDLAEYVEYMGYTHVELMGISEHPFDGSWGYQVTGYYAPTSRYGTPEDFQYFVNYLHSKGIGIIVDWVPAHFPRDAFALARFDGEPLFEHPDSRRGEHPDWGTYIFNFGKTEVMNFLIGSALFWLEKFHIDGLRTDAVASMLYLDYGKQSGQWLPNKYGGNENLEAVEFLKHMNSIIAKRDPGCMIIAEESTAWPKVTSRAEDGGLGFTYKWNMGWMNDFLEYVSMDPLFRKNNHYKMTFAMSYHHAEKYILVLSHDEVVHGKCSMFNKMPGLEQDKFAGLRTSYGFMIGHPGKKLLFMGQEFAQRQEWSEERSIDWYLLDDPYHKGMHDWTRALLHLAKEYPAIYATDYSNEGFQWINCDDTEKSVYSFTRISPDGKKSLLFVCNFTPVVWEDFRVGVPNAGKYKAILNSDSKYFGGNDEYINEEDRADKRPWDNREYSIPVTLPPLGCVVYEYNYKKPETEKEKAAKAKEKKEKAARAKEKKPVAASKKTRQVKTVAEAKTKKSSTNATKDTAK